MGRVGNFDDFFVTTQNTKALAELERLTPQN